VVVIIGERILFCLVVFSFLLMDDENDDAVVVVIVGVAEVVENGIVGVVGDNNFNFLVKDFRPCGFFSSSSINSFSIVGSGIDTLLLF